MRPTVATCAWSLRWAWTSAKCFLRVQVLRAEREEVRKQPDEGVHVYGLFIEGCRWDKQGNRLAESEPKVLFAPVPVLLVSGQLASEKQTGGHLYSAPCYKNPSRTDRNFIFAVDLRTEEQPTKWTLRGVCLLTSKDI